MNDDPHRDHIDRSPPPLSTTDEFAFPAGFHYLPGYLSTPSQLALLSDVRKVLDEAPLFEQAMSRTGAPLSVRMSNLSNHAPRYRQAMASLCIINYYDRNARLGLHQDRGDSSVAAPVVSISLGDDATFLLGGMLRKDPVRRLALRSGDVIWFGGPSRLIFHGVECIHYGGSRLLKAGGIAEGGRLNLTLRRTDRAPAGQAR